MKAKVDIKLQMIVDVLKTADCIDSIVTATLKPYNVTHIQYNILRILRGAQPHPLFVGELKSRLLFANSDITRILDRMVKRGIIERKVCADNRRKVEILINKNGLDLLDECTPELYKALRLEPLQDLVADKDSQNVSAILNILRTELLNSN